MGDREGCSRPSTWDMSCHRKLFLDERKSFSCQMSVFRMQANLHLMFERHGVDMTYPGQPPELPSLSHHFLLSLLIHQDCDRDGFLISDLNQHIFLWFYFSIFSLVLVPIEKIYQTREPCWAHFQTLWTSLKKLCCYVSHFQLSSQCLEM